MGEQCSAEGLHQAGRSSGVTRSDTFAKRPQQRLSRVGKKIFPLTQFRKRNGYGCLVFLIFGTLSCGSFPRARCLEQRTPAIEPRFCTCKELIHSNVGCSCCDTHDGSPLLAFAACARSSCESTTYAAMSSSALALRRAGAYLSRAKLTDSPQLTLR